MINLRSAWKTLLNYPGVFCLTVLQFAVIIVLTLIIFSSNLILNRSSEKITELVTANNFFFLVDQSNEKQLFEEIFKEDDIKERMVAFYQFISSHSEFNFIDNYETVTLIHDAGPHEKLEQILENSSRSINQNVISIQTLAVLSNFFTIFPIALNQGEFTEDGIILGSHFQGSYNIGDTLPITDEETGKVLEKKITGFLETESFFYSSSEGIVDLGRYLIKALPEVKETLEYVVPEIDHRINQSLIVTNNVSTTLQIINQKSQELNLYTQLKAVSLEEKNQQVLSVFQNARNQLIPGVIVISIFGLISLLIALLGIIQKKLPEIMIHLLIGATFKDIGKQLLIVMYTYLFLAGSLGVFVYKVISQLLLPESIPLLQLLAYTTLSLLLLGLVAIIYPLKIISRLSLGRLLKKA